MNEALQLTDILTSHKRDRGDLVPLLQEVQSRFGYLPREAMLEIAGFLQIPESTVWGIASFYNQFRFTPLGRNPVKVCMGTACHMAGGKLVLEAMERELDIKVGGVTPEGEFSLERVACIGCCVMAPVVVISDDVHGKMNPLKVEEALIPYKRQS